MLLTANSADIDEETMGKYLEQLGAEGDGGAKVPQPGHHLVIRSGSEKHPAPAANHRAHVQSKAK